MAVRSVCLVFSLIALASPVRGLEISADGTTFGTIITSYLFAALFLIATLLSLLSLLKTPRCRFPYFLLFLTSAFSLGAFATSSALFTAEHSNEPYSNTLLIALNTLHALFTNWAVPCLFLAVILIAKQRHAALEHVSHASGGYGVGSVNVIVVIANYVLFIFAFALSATHGVLTVLTWKTLLDETVSADEKARVEDVERTAHLILQVMIWLVAFDVGVLAFTLYLAMKKAELFDRVCQLLALCVAPLGVLAGFVDLIFEVIFYVHKNSRDSDTEHLINTVIVQLLYLAIIVSLLIIGFRPQDWDIEKDPNYGYGGMNKQKARQSQPEARRSHYQLHRLTVQASRATQPSQPSVHSPHSPVAQYWRESLTEQFGQGSNKQRSYPILRHQYAIASTAHVPSVRDMYTQEIESLHRQHSRHK